MATAEEPTAFKLQTNNLKILKQSTIKSNVKPQKTDYTNISFFYASNQGGKFKTPNSSNYTMFSYDGSSIPQDSYVRPCSCAEEEDEDDLDKSFCYVEGTELDANRSDNKAELSESIWFETKPPRLFSKGLSPLVTARQIHISRIIMSGTRAQVTHCHISDPPKEKTVIKLSKKKSTVKFLSTINSI